MRKRRYFGLVLFVLILLPWQAKAYVSRVPKAPTSDIVFGAQVLGHLEASVGLMEVSIGLWDRIMIGTDTLPWMVGFFAKGSLVANGFVKAKLFDHRKFSLGLRTGVFNIDLNDLDKDGLNLQALVVPTRLYLAADWTKKWTTSLELAAVYASMTGNGLADKDVRVFGVAVASNIHGGLVQRYRWRKWITLWARMRILLNHLPVRVEAHTNLSDIARLNLSAKANASELSSGVAGTVGTLFSMKRTNLRMGVGYGTWFLPWIALPVGTNIPFADFELSWRF